MQTSATSIADLKIMLNEIYARHGYIFRPGGEMDRYFRQQPWYRPRYANVDYLITETEHRNIKLLKELLSPESQRKKALYIQNTTDFCEALKAN
ncbi:YARHG domain-containing protein, partial [Salmonella sp. SAL01998]|uniref:YARHG domain-containing protein n=1 Tax=Salmonella sp. SAL01998 TaxID=3159757 RepID=UPI003979C92E